MIVKAGICGAVSFLRVMGLSVCFIILHIRKVLYIGNLIKDKNLHYMSRVIAKMQGLEHQCLMETV